MSLHDHDLDDLRARLSALDGELLAAVARRLELVAEIGRVKRAQGLPDRDVGREAKVVALAEEEAVRLGVPKELTKNIMNELIRASLGLQEHERVEARQHGVGRRALVIGGAGRMGRWFVRFLASQGFEVEVADPAGPVGAYKHFADWHDAELDADLLVVAAPLAVSQAILRELSSRRPPGLVFDVGSLKTPLWAALQALAEAGVQVTSVHPMFGPDTELLSGRHLIFVDVGVPQATAQAKALFSSTMASLVEMSPDEHDQLIGYVLGLAHALNIVFLTALRESGLDPRRFERISSTTFEAQLEVSRRVSRENPHLYFEIQRLNAHGRAPLEALRRSVDSVVSRVLEGDEEGFVKLMEGGRAYLEGLGQPEAKPGQGA